MLAFWLAGAAIFCFLFAALGAFARGAAETVVGWLGFAFLAAAMVATRSQRPG